MAKNKNQNRQREQRSDRQNSGSQAQEPNSPTTEEHMMPAATQTARRQQKRFGHN